MHINAGYLNNSRTDFKDNSTPLVVGSCGTYRLKTRPKLPTYWQKRAQGLPDFICGKRKDAFLV